MKQFALLIAFTLLSACATVTASGDQELSITTVPAGARCDLGNTQQDAIIESTPGTVTVKRMYEPLDIICRMPGYANAEGRIEAKTRGRTYGNILLLGVPAVVDASTGKGYEYDPAELRLTLVPAAQ